MAIYHVIRDWDGGDLKTLAQRIDDGEIDGVSDYDEALEWIAAKWDDPANDPARYLDTEGRQVHFHYTLAEAVEYRDDLCPGGEILAIDDSELEVAVGDEYPHPVVEGSVPAELVAVVEIECESA